MLLLAVDKNGLKLMILSIGYLQKSGFSVGFMDSWWNGIGIYQSDRL